MPPPAAVHPLLAHAQIGNLFTSANGNTVLVCEKVDPVTIRVKVLPWTSRANWSSSAVDYKFNDETKEFTAIRGHNLWGRISEISTKPLSEFTLAQLAPDDGVHKAYNSAKNFVGLISVFGGVATFYPVDSANEPEVLTFSSLVPRRFAIEFERPSDLGKIHFALPGRIVALNYDMTPEVELGGVSPGTIAITWANERSICVIRLREGGNYDLLAGSAAGLPSPIPGGWGGVVLRGVPLRQPKVGDVYQAFSGRRVVVYGVDSDRVYGFDRDRGRRLSYHKVSSVLNGVQCFQNRDGDPNYSLCRFISESREFNLSPMPKVGQVWSSESGYTSIIRSVGRSHVVIDQYRLRTSNVDGGFVQFKSGYTRTGETWALTTNALFPLVAHSAQLTPQPVPEAGQIWRCRDPNMRAVLFGTQPGDRSQFRAVWLGNDQRWPDAHGWGESLLSGRIHSTSDGLWSAHVRADGGESGNETDLSELEQDLGTERIAISSRGADNLVMAALSEAEYEVAPLWNENFRVCPAAWSASAQAPFAVANLHMYECEHCHGSFDRRLARPMRVVRNIGARSETVETWCTACYRTAYRDCPSCGTTYDATVPGTSAMGDCPTCVTRGRIRYFRNYSFRPEPVFHGPDPLQFGVELEIGINRDVEQERGSKIICDAASGLVYCKSDGSIGHGIEMVTHPFSLEWMHANTAIFESWFKALVTIGGEPNNSCGMHIHTSKAGYLADPSTVAERPGMDLKKRQYGLGLLRTQRLVYHNARDITHFAGRCSEQYASLKIEESKPRMSRDHRDSHTTEREIVSLAKNPEARKAARYSAMNLTEKTVEFRIYASTKEVHRLYARVEFTHALIAYCKSRKLAERPGFGAFAKWVLNNEDTYPSLVRLEREYLTAASKRKDAVVPVMGIPLPKAPQAGGPLRPATTTRSFGTRIGA